MASKRMHQAGRTGPAAVRRFRALLACAALALAGCATSPAAPAEEPALIEDSRAALGLPGVAVAIWREGRIAEYSTGERALGGGDPVRDGDPFHLGSVTKPFTATLAARLVEQGRLSWSDTVAQRLGDLPGTRADYRAVTLGDLLAHRGGLPDNPSPAARAGIDPGEAVTRRQAAAIILAERPAAPPRRRFRYSNFHYVVAAAMIEQATGRSWEEIVFAELIDPLGIAGAGFDAPGGEAPRGHLSDGRPVAPGPDADNPPFARPAGGLHMPARSLMMFGVDHLRGARGEVGTLLAPASYRRLHARVGDGEATGWTPGRRGEVHHDGSNGRWFALLRVLPREGLVIAIAANSAGPDEQRTRRGLWALSERLRRHGGASGARG